MKKKITYILVADGARARLYVNEGVGKGMQPVSGATHQSHVPAHNRDLTTDRPGRAFSTATRSASVAAPRPLLARDRPKPGGAMPRS